MVDFYRLNRAVRNGLKRLLLVEKVLWILDVKGLRVNVCFSSNSGWKNIMGFLCPQETCRSVLAPLIFNSQRTRESGEGT